MGRYKRIIEKLIALQNKFFLDAKPYYEQGKDKVALLRVVGLEGETLLLKCDGDRILYADGDQSPTEVFECSEDTFIDLVAEPTAENFTDKVTLGHFCIRNGKTGEISIVEIEKWKRGFERLGRVAKHLVGVK